MANTNNSGFKPRINEPDYNFDGLKHGAPVFLKDEEVTTSKVLSKHFDKLSDTNKELILSKGKVRLSSLFNWFSKHKQQ